jgi:protein involved in polysaccharide export with SLBB domain
MKKDILTIRLIERQLGNYLKFLLLFLSVIYFNTTTFSQSVFSAANLSEFKTASLDDGQINRIKSEMSSRNISLAELENIAIGKGMPPSEFALLKQRLDTEIEKTNVDKGTTIAEKPIELDKNSSSNPSKFHQLIFGSEIFSSSSLSFEPNPNLAVPPTYVLGPGDELQLVIYGVQQFAGEYTVNKEGKVTIPNIGQVHVGGLSFGAAEVLLKKRAAAIYRTIGSGQSELSVTISKFKTIRITILGARKPGNYSISSLSTVFNALHIAGGPDDNGSYRNIELIRNHKVYKIIDIYRFLLFGDDSDNMNLKDNDIIRIPVYTNRVRIEGKIKRSGIFELKQGESFEDLLTFCSGFDESAYVKSIKLIQNTEKELKISDLPESDYQNYKPQNGDVFKVGQILNRFENRVSIKGAVFRPDEYALTDGLTLKQLIERADGLTEDAYVERIQLIREREDLIKEVVGLDLSKILTGEQQDIVLRREDEIIISSKFELKENFNVTIYGQVQKPGTYMYLENMTLYDLILQAGGFAESASSRIEVSRMIKNDSIDLENESLSQVFTIELENRNLEASKNMLLNPKDAVQIRKMPTYENLKMVSVTGQTIFPGSYALITKNDKVLDVIKRAGGIDVDANPKGIKVIRRLDKVGTEKVEKIEVTIPINYEVISRRPSSRRNITLQPGDEIVISKITESIKVVGEVELNSEIPIRSAKGVRYYINSVGGFKDNANRKKTYVVYANGKAKRTSRVLFFNNYPPIELGCQIVVPKKPEKVKDSNLAEIVGISGIVGSLAGMTVAIVRLFQ